MKRYRVASWELGTRDSRSCHVLHVSEAEKLVHLSTRVWKIASCNFQLVPSLYFPFLHISLLAFFLLTMLPGRTSHRPEQLSDVYGSCASVSPRCQSSSAQYLVKYLHQLLLCFRAPFSLISMRRFDQISRAHTFFFDLSPFMPVPIPSVPPYASS